MRSLLLFLVIATLGVVQPPRWKLVLVAGSDDQHVFDNARDAVKAALLNKTALGTETAEYTADYLEAGKPHLTLSTVANFADALTVNDGKCFLYITSHGSPAGVVIGKELMDDTLLDAILTDKCKGPTVLIVSACYSGRFVSEKMQKPNRVILTAARNDRSSFGCSNDLTYTYWDGCLLKVLPEATHWSEVYAKTTECVNFLERQVNANLAREGSNERLAPSLPQFYRGGYASDNILN